MLLSSARMAQVLATMQAQASGAAGSASSSGNGLHARQSSSDELAALLPGAATFAVSAVAAGTHQAGSTGEGSAGCNMGADIPQQPQQHLSLRPLQQHPTPLPPHDIAAPGASFLGYAQGAASALAAPPGALCAALPFDGRSSDSSSNSNLGERQSADVMWGSPGTSSGGVGDAGTAGKRGDGAAGGGCDDDVAAAKRTRY
jgi:hypothetical protein